MIVRPPAQHSQENNSLNYSRKKLLTDRTSTGLYDNYLSCSTDNAAISRGEI